jgi:adenylate cyclase
MPWPQMWRRGHRGVVTILAAVLAVVASLAAGTRMDPVAGLVYDLSLTATATRPGTGGEPVAVIALDDESLASNELKPLPRVFFAQVWAKVLNGLNSGGARTVGFDVIFAWSSNNFAPLQRDYDQPFLLALKNMRDRVVIGGTVRTPPAETFAFAVSPFGSDAYAYTEMTADSDGVQRTMAAALHDPEGNALPTLAAAVLAKARAPAMPNGLVLAPAASLETIPTYRLIDVLRCIDQDPGAVRAAFDGRIVLIGTNLPEEDRKRGPDRFMASAQPRPGTATGCKLDRLGASDAASGTIPGVILHAAAVQAVATGNIVEPAPAVLRTCIAVAASVAGSALGIAASPWLAVAGVVVVVIACFALAVALLPLGWWLVITVPVAAAALSMVLAYLVRFLVEERRRRRVQHAFNHYLAPSLVERLADSEAELHLGGELREVTVMFADLSGFTALSGKVGPEVLMEVTNRYLGLIVEAVEATGGYVDKFIGDAVMAVWGAPVPNPDHAAAGARAALAAYAAVMRAKTEADARSAPGYAVKMGLNSGPAVVGNVGAPMRYNYTAVGETVNIAARLESVPGDYGCHIVLGPQTAAAVADRFIVCELDWLKVKGKADAFAVYELIGEKVAVDTAVQAYPAQYHAALERYRAGDFAAAEEGWRERAAYPYRDGATCPALVMAARCAELKAAPPAEWDGVFVKTSK